MVTMREISKANREIRDLLKLRGIKHYEAARACGVSYSTFSHWLQVELPKAKKIEIIDVINNIK